MTREKKDRLYDENDKITQDMVHPQTEHECIVDYNLRKNNYNDDSNRNQFKQHLTLTKQVDERDICEDDNNYPFTFVSRGAKRKPKGLNEKENNGNKER
ncbi:unnamed protein product [Rotaria sp. Silwood2]|nr:unnamed protein product [Rotaria sp. Silwood2]CAF4178978.1 unnamed protein product [Rotaria sp. Silwood2]